MAKLISFEGIPGSGKTTVLNFVRNMMEQSGIRAIDIGTLLQLKEDRIRDKVDRLLSYQQHTFFKQEDPFIEAYLFQAMHAYVCHELLVNNDSYDVFLEDQGSVTRRSVLAVRFDSCYHIPIEETMEWLQHLDRLFINPIPHSSVYLQCSVAEAKTRYQAASRHLQSADWVFSSRLQTVLETFASNHNEITKINTDSQSIEQVGQKVLDQVLK